VKYGLCCLFVAGLAISFDLSPISAQIFNGYRKGVQIVNLEGSDATISIIGYQEDGSVESSNSKYKEKGLKYVYIRTNVMKGSEYVQTNQA